MAGVTRPDILTDNDYEQLLALLAGTAKGRTFLSEYASQARAEDTRALFAALAAIQSSLAVIRDQLHPDALAGELRRIAAALEEGAVGKARAELAGLADALVRGAALGVTED
jgi:hypothetical protein